MCKKRSIKNKVLYSFAIIVFMAAILFPIVGSKNVSAQWLYYPANAISLYGTPSITLPYPAPLPTLALTSPYNLYYPAGTLPGIPYLPPLVSPISTATAPLAASPLTSTFSLPSSIYYSPINVLSPLTLSVYSSLSPLASLAPVASTANVYNLYYPAGTIPGISIAPPVATGVGTLPYNLYYTPGTAPGIPVLPPLP